MCQVFYNQAVQYRQVNFVHLKNEEKFNKFKAEKED